MKILLTGFEAFEGVEDNPSQWLMEHFAALQTAFTEAELLCFTLATAYEGAGEKIRQLIDHHQPDLILCTGVAAGRSELSLERVALNLNQSEIADNEGERREGSFIREGAALAYHSSSDVQRIKEKLNQQGMPLKVSNHAGTYVCNHVYFCALDEIQEYRPVPPCLFMHIPQVSGQALALWGLVKSVEMILLEMQGIKNRRLRR
ncbi:pyroglutamyl-peptidase I [Anaerolineales bacterium]